MFIEALCRVCAAWMMIKMLPYAIWCRKLGCRVDSQRNEGMPDLRQSQVIGDVTWVHAMLEWAFGARFSCLMLALSARNMLARRGIESSLILGVERSRHHQAGENIFRAHAWVNAMSYCVVGASGSERFIEVACYKYAEIK